MINTLTGANENIEINPDSKIQFYMAGMHHVVKAFEAAGVTFPISKADLLAKVGDADIQVDYASTIKFSDLSKNIKQDAFVNKAQFFNALGGSNTVFNF
ncbi:MAG: hypothetical protein LBN22_09830 [Clostridiales Family XIII bacterium]|jgi:hypothetical protein|nr:hypothetical protein [Clostridiales Family XIII bacterium]